jgi:hypothetical protein
MYCYSVYISCNVSKVGLCVSFICRFSLLVSYIWFFSSVFKYFHLFPVVIISMASTIVPYSCPELNNPESLLLLLMSCMCSLISYWMLCILVDKPGGSFDRCHFHCIYLFVAEALTCFVSCFVCGRLLLYKCVSKKFCNASYIFTTALLCESNPLSFLVLWVNVCICLCFFWGGGVK